MNFKPVFYVIGILLLVLAAAQLGPMFLDLADNNADWQVFASSMTVTAFAGLALVLMNRQKEFKITLRETFLLTCIAWIFIAGFAALPFHFSQAEMSYAGAFFEAMSAITTTGSTAISGLDDLPRGILIWRFLLLWIGGIGFLIIALAVFPLLQISGMQIFKTQSFQIEKVMPSASQMAAFICLIYVILTFVSTVILYLCGMSPFDALCHGMAALSTGGISTHDAVSYLTTTGFINGDHSEWGHFAIGIAFLAGFLGSCSGSTSGGIKLFRLQILFLTLRQQLRKLTSPHGVFPVHYNGKPVEPTLQAAVAGFFFIYIISWLLIGVALQLTGLDFSTAFSGALAAISNTGVGIGDMIGPSGNFANLPSSAVWVFSFAMLFGRIEFLTLLVLLTPHFWKG